MHVRRWTETASMGRNESVGVRFERWMRPLPSRHQIT